MSNQSRNVKRGRSDSPLEEDSGNRVAKKVQLEKLRRDRMNRSFFLLKEFHAFNNPNMNSKLEKADLLEMTVDYVKSTVVPNKNEQKEERGKEEKSSDKENSLFQEGAEYGRCQALQVVCAFIQTMTPFIGVPMVQQLQCGIAERLQLNSLPVPSSAPTISHSQHRESSPQTPDSSNCESPSMGTPSFVETPKGIPSCQITPPSYSTPTSIDPMLFLLGMSPMNSHPTFRQRLSQPPFLSFPPSPHSSPSLSSPSLSSSSMSSSFLSSSLNISPISSTTTPVQKDSKVWHPWQ